MDLERILVTGHSMGGHGCFVFAAHFPGHLVGAACAASWPSFYLYSGQGERSGMLDDARMGLVDQRKEHDAAFLSGNMRGLPMLIVYGSQDTSVPINLPRYEAQLVDESSGNPQAVQVVEIKNDPHWFSQNVRPLVNFFSVRLAPSSVAGGRLPLPPLPETFDFTVSHPATFGTKGYMELLQKVNEAEPARFFVQRCPHHAQTVTPLCKGTSNLGAPWAKLTAKPGADPLWDVETFNVHRFRLKWPRSLPHGRSWPLALRVDGILFQGQQLDTSGGRHFCRKEPFDRQQPPEWQICLHGAAPMGPLYVRGPSHMVLRQSLVCIVHGSAEGQAAEALALANKMHFVSKYMVPIVDGSVTPPPEPSDQCADANLVLIGSPRENQWTEKFKCSFPYVRMLSDGTSFALNGLAYSAENTALIAVGGLPGGHLAMWLHSIGPLGMTRAVNTVPVSSNQDDADFQVLGPEIGWLGEGGLLAAGHLDYTWRIAPDSSYAEPEHSVGPRLRSIRAPLEGQDPECVTVSPPTPLQALGGHAPLGVYGDDNDDDLPTYDPYLRYKNMLWRRPSDEEPIARTALKFQTSSAEQGPAKVVYISQPNMQVLNPFIRWKQRGMPMANLTRHFGEVYNWHAPLA
eukprot:gnl/TRDRNA2_/TRDRNA2_148736_c2_seq2.p1 gnl/TRDRNA2_/TRDRNA2_148736_c2~~gnl/TRDRNA2_/TRDRNA2_148736_c2_seq2.p1  ORF type:complete len:629 (+),score=53.07 gnl/TRDRNA2_/TRDRNA2_148736_c2_seq2:165-2051(+)